MIWFSNKLYIGILFFCIISSNLFAQDFSNKGKDFWITYPAHIDGANSAMGIYITCDVAATGSIFVGNKTLNFSVTPNNVVRKFIGPNGGGDAPSGGVYLTQIDGITSGAAIHVISDNPVVVYAHIIRSHRSGASLILPTTVWGRQYIVPSYSNVGNSGSGSSEYGYGTITVVAKDTNTVVQITPKLNSRSGTRKANTPYQITLAKPGDVYQVEFDQSGDISGTLVESISSGIGGCKKIAVFSSTTWSSFGCSNAGSGDNLYQQLFPTGAWGKNFLTAPAATRNNDIFRIFVKDTSTIVTFKKNGIDSTFPKSALQAGSFYEYETFEPTYITANKPVSAIQYFTTEKCDGGTIGDPEMISLNPVEQTINNITVFSAHQNWVPSGQSDITNCYLNIIIQTTAAPSFTINGFSPSGNFLPIPGTSYSYLQEDITNIAAQNPVQNLSADSNFIAIAYGFGDVESYGYNAGTNIKDFSQFLTVQNPYPSTFNNNTACTNNPFHIGVVLPFKPASIIWNFSNNTNLSPNATITNNSPIADSTYILNGVTQYYFKLAGTFMAKTTQAIPLKLTVDNPTSDGCSGIQDIDYLINITQSPTSSFKIVSTGCSIDSVYFFNNSTDNGTAITQYSWNLDNGTITPAINNPSVLYPTAKDYTVKLLNISSLGCYSDTTKIVSLSTVPIVAFTQVNPACKNGITQFTDQSSIVVGSLTHWYWNFGNGHIDSLLNTSTVSQVFDSIAVDTVRLTILSNTGCRSSAIKLVPINYLPQAGFTVPDICLNDAFAQFNDTSSIPDGTQSSFVYLWNFGDQNANPAHPNTDITQNGTHKFTAVGSYTIHLQVTSNNGCIDTISHPFMVNGTIPIANFEILNKGTLCSDLPVKLLNTSTVDFGNITQVEIYWDYANNPTTKYIDSNPATNKVYSFTYYNFHQPLSQQFTIHYVAYSGITCVSTKDTTITVNATPEIALSVFPSKSICYGDSVSFKATATGITAPLINSWFWDFGDSLNSDSQFVRKLYTDSGTFQLNLYAIIYNGCYQKITDTIIVHPVPTVTIPKVINVLEGKSVILSPIYTGLHLRYVWQPNIYLDNDTLPYPLCTPKVDTFFTIKATNNFNCSDTAGILVRVLFTPLIPNIFSPNGDGNHDTWHIEYLYKYPKSTIDVFDRGGQRVFHAYNYDSEWDGTYNGSPVPIGTYYYIINPLNGRPTLTGSVTIIR